MDSAKLPPYLASGTPILARGPITATQIRYLHDLGIDHVVPVRKKKALIEAIQRWMFNESYRRQLESRGRDTALLEHEGKRVRVRFQSVICNLVPSELR